MFLSSCRRVDIMDASSMLELMRSREETTSQELMATLAEAQRLNAKLAVLRQRQMTRPSTPLGAIDGKLQQLELRRVTSSLTLQEEKMLLKEIDRVRSAKKEHAAVDAKKLEIENIKKKADAAFAKVTLMRDSLSELRAASKTLQLCAQIQGMKGEGSAAVMPKDLETKMLDVPDPSVLGQIIGKGGANIKRFRNKHCVVFDTVDEEGQTVAIKLTGLPDGLESASAELEGIINAISKETSISSGVMTAMMRNRASLLHRLQDRFAVSLEPESRSNDENSPSIKLQIKVQGAEEQVDECIKYLASFEKQAGEVECATENLSAVVGTKAKRLIDLQNEFGVYVSIDREAAVFRVFHEDTDQISACMEKLTQLVEEYMQREENISIDPRMASSIIGKGGANIQQLQKDTKCFITIDREDRSRVILKGTRSALDAAKEQMQLLCDKFAQENQTIQFPPKLVGVLIAQSGNLIKKLEKTHGVRINVNRRDGSVLISGSVESVVAAKDELASIQESCGEETIKPVSAEEIGMVIGKAGATIQRLTSTYKCEINIDRKSNAIVCTGVGDNVNEASAEIKAMIDTYRKENIEFEVDPQFLPSFIGKGGANIVKFRGEHNVEVSLGSRGSGIVKIRGKEDTAQAAKEAMLEAQQFWKATNISIPVQNSQIDLLIGHKGETIKRLQKESDCSIDLRRKEQVARIRGEDEEKVQAAVKMVTDIIGGTWVTEEISLPVANASSLVIGRGGETIRRLQQEHSVTIDLSSDSSASDSKSNSEGHGFITVSGLVDSVKAATEDIAKIFHDNVRFFKNLKIDASLIPGLIGKRGDNIMRVQKESGADIEIVRPNADNPSSGNEVGNGRYQFDSPFEPVDSSPLEPGQAYVVLRGNVDQLQRSIELVNDVISSLRYDQIALKAHHMSSLKQQQNGKIVQVELHYNIKVTLDLTQNTVTFDNNERNSRNKKKIEEGEENLKPRIMAAWGEVHKILSFFHPKEFARLDIPSDLAREVDRVLPEMRVNTGAYITTINMTNTTVLIMGDEVQVAAALEKLQGIKAKYLKNSRDVRVPSELIPQIIGKGGSNLNAFQKKHKVQANIDKTDKGLVHLRGEVDGLDSAAAALNALKEKFEANTRRIQFDEEATGIIVGRGGSTIRQLQSDFQVNIDIKSNSNPAQAIIRGEPENLDKAVGAIKKLLEDAGYGENVKTEDMRIAREHIGAVVGESGSVVRQIESDTRCQIRIQKDASGGVVAIRGSPEAVALAKSKISDIVAEQEADARAREQEIKRAREAEEAAREAESASIDSKERSSSSESAGVSMDDSAVSNQYGGPTSNSRYVPGMPRDWNMQAEEGYSMSSTAQKNRRKRERKKAAAKANSQNEHAKQEHYQQNLQQLLFANDTGNAVATPNSFHPAYSQQSASTEQPHSHPSQMMFPGMLSGPSVTSHAPPGFERPTRSPPPGFENEALTRLADLGFSSSIGQPVQQLTSNNVPAVAKKPAVYVSARGGYKLRL